jgi:rubrerythrin
MALTDPVVAYHAATNMEAQMVKMKLVEVGIEAFAAEDFSPGGYWMFGTLPMIFKAQVLVDRRDLERAKTVVAEFETAAAQRRQTSRPHSESETEVIVVRCEDCGRKSGYPASQRGTVQECPKCGAYVDVGEFDENEFLSSESDEPSTE